MKQITQFFLESESATLTWSANCVMSNAAANQATTFAITDTKVYVPVVTVIN